MHVSFVTLFPDLLHGYFGQSILKRAIDAKLLSVDFINPRDFTTDKHLKVDRAIIGGGAGLLMSPQPLYDTLKQITKKSPNAHIIYPTPNGKRFSQNDAKRLAKKEHLVFICGRYEGIDERIIEELCDEVFCVGDFIVTGGELPSLMMCDGISRNVEGVLGNKTSLEEESFEEGLLEAPAFTKPNNFKGSMVPLEFLKGNHGKIAVLKKLLSLSKTKFFRPDLFIKNKSVDKKDKK